MKTHRRAFLFCILVTFLSSFFISGCGSNVTGEVVDKFTRKPISGVTISAITSTNLAEDKKYEKRYAKTNATGVFKVKGLSPNYYYQITAEKDGYFTINDSKTSVKPPEKGKTRILDNNLILIKKNLVDGSVVDRFTFKPVPEARIDAVAFLRGIIVRENTVPLDSTSNDNGVFEIGPFIPDINYTLRVFKDGYAYAEDMSFKNPGQLTKMNEEIKLLKLPSEYGVFLISGKNNSEYKKIAIFQSNVNKIKITRNIGAGGSNTYTRYYVPQKEIQSAINLDADEDSYLLIYFEYQAIKDSEQFIVPLGFFKKLPIEYNYRDWKKHDIRYLKEENVYLYANKGEGVNINESEGDMPDNWRETKIDSLSPERYRSNNRRCILISLKEFESGIYAFTLDHGAKWLFSKS